MDKLLASLYLYFDWNGIMRKKSLQLCGFTCIMGIFGAFLRWVQLVKIIEPETGLATAHSPWSYTLVIFSLLNIASLVLWIRSFKKYSFPLKYPDAFSRGLSLYSIAAMVIGAVMALGGVLTVIRSLGSSGTVFDLVLGLFSFICALGASSFVISANKPNKKTGGTIQSAAIILFLCYWLIAAYKFSASDPVIWHFAPRLLAVSSTILAFYYIAGFVFNSPKPLLSLFFCQLGAFLCIITLADSYPLGEQLITLAFAALMMLLSFAQVSNISTEKISE